MRAAVVAGCIVLAAGAGCAQLPNPFGSSGPAPRPEPPEAVHLDVDGFDVELNPTVQLWGQDAGVDVRAIVRRALRTIERRLKAPPTTIRIHAGGLPVIPEVGIGGSTHPASGEVRIFLDPRSPVGLRTLLTVWLPMALAHELHHSKRIVEGPGYGATLLEALVTEGAAEAFVRETYPDAPIAPWVLPLSRKQQGRVWRRARTELRALDEAHLHEVWFYGRDGVPRWAGYKLGYAIVAAYMRSRPGTSAAELATVPAAHIFAASGYEPRA